MVGAALKGSRDKIVLSSKSEAKTAPDAVAELDTSLKELGTDHLDIWYMHSRDTVAAIPDELVAVWENAKQQGKIRHIGISTHKPNAIVDRVLAVGKFEVMLSTYSFAIGTANDPAYEKLTAAGVGLVAMKVMAPAARARKPDGPLAALKWVLRDPRFTTAIPSMTDMEQLEMNVRAMAEPFGTADEKLLARLDENIRPLYCRMCNQCSGQCPKGAPHSGDPPLSVLCGFLWAIRPWPGTFPGAAGRGACRALQDCASCQVRCPNGVHVSDRLIRAQELFG